VSGAKNQTKKKNKPLGYQQANLQKHLQFTRNKGHLQEQSGM
jgi:hypothetical protein